MSLRTEKKHSLIQKSKVQVKPSSSSSDLRSLAVSLPSVEGLEHLRKTVYKALATQQLHWKDWLLGIVTIATRLSNISHLCHQIWIGLCSSEFIQLHIPGFGISSIFFKNIYTPGLGLGVKGAKKITQVC